jgi:hypothetical protein
VCELNGHRVVYWVDSASNGSRYQKNLSLGGGGGGKA